MSLGSRSRFLYRSEDAKARYQLAGILLEKCWTKVRPEVETVATDATLTVGIYRLNGFEFVFTTDYYECWIIEDQAATAGATAAASLSA